MSRNPTAAQAMEMQGTVYEDIHMERVNAHTKHSANGNSREDAEWDNVEWLPILMEEVGEVAHHLTYDSDTAIDDLRSELVQVAAMAAAWIASIDETMEGSEPEEAEEE
jgi:NTP pyrophosphatase (non-canonical NTP hydrolase)